MEIRTQGKVSEWPDIVYVLTTKTEILKAIGELLRIWFQKNRISLLMVSIILGMSLKLHVLNFFMSQVINSTNRVSIT